MTTEAPAAGVAASTHPMIRLPVGLPAGTPVVFAAFPNGRSHMYPVRLRKRMLYLSGNVRMIWFAVCRVRESGDDTDYGGVYLDTDLYLIPSLSALRVDLSNHAAFDAVLRLVGAAVAPDAQAPQVPRLVPPIGGRVPWSLQVTASGGSLIVFALKEPDQVADPVWLPLGVAGISSATNAVEVLSLLATQVLSFINPETAHVANS